MNRRDLLKILSLLPFVGPSIAKALATSSAGPEPVFVPYLPKYFPKWNRAVDGLEEAGKWALALERSRLPGDALYPTVGQIWECVRECRVNFRLSIRRQWSPSLAVISLSGLGALEKEDLAMLWLGGVTCLQPGERIRVVGVDADKPLLVTFIPVRYDELHSGIVPERFRSRPDYQGYELSLKTARTISDFSKEPQASFFNEAFRLTSPGFAVRGHLRRATQA